MIREDSVEGQESRTDEHCLFFMDNNVKEKQETQARFPTKLLNTFIFIFLLEN